MWLVHDTKVTLGVGADLCENRALWFERFAAARLAGAEARVWGEQIAKAPALRHRHEAWRRLLLTRLPAATTEVVCGRLLEPLGLGRPGRRGLASGLAMDRCTGVPYLPGSVVRRGARGVARHRIRSAKAEEWSELGFAFGLVFGWAELESMAPPGVGAGWESALREIRSRLQRFLAAPTTPIANRVEDGLARFVGLVSFLPAYPWRFEQCQLSWSHPISASGHAGRGGPPAVGEPGGLEVAAGTEFVFPLTGPRELRAQARAWLEGALRGGLFRTRHDPPHGRFEVTDALQHALDFARQREAGARAAQAAEAERRAREELLARQREREEREAAVASLSATERQDYELTQLTEEQFRARVQTFRQFPAKEQLPVLRVLLGPRLAAWEELKRRAAKGGQWAQVEQAIRAAAKKANLGKMP